MICWHTCTVHMCMYMYICIYVCVYIYIYIYNMLANMHSAYTCASILCICIIPRKHLTGCERTCACMNHVRVYTCMHACLCTNMFIGTCRCIYICTHTHICVCVCIYIYIYIYIVGITVCLYMRTHMRQGVRA